MKIRFYNFIVFILIFAFCGFCGYRIYAVYNVNEEKTSEEKISIVEEKCGSGSVLSLLENTYHNATRIPFNKPIHSRCAYNNLLSGTEREIYDLIEEKVYNILPQKDASGSYYIEAIKIKESQADEAILKKVFRAFQYDNPRIFWLSNVMGILKNRGSITLSLKSVVSLEECLEISKRLDLEINKIIKSVPGGLSEYERELWIHDLIIQRCKYGGIPGERSDWRKFTIVGAILDGKAVCEGFAKAMKDLLNGVGIECRLIIGQRGKEAHMWNIVKINGAWYHLDATWDSGSNTGKYRYFNLNDDMIKLDHDVYASFTVADYLFKNDKYNFKLPKCISTQENYIYKNGIRLDLFSKETDNYMIEKIKEAIREKRRNIYIIIGKEIKVNEAISWLFKASNFKFFYYLREIEKDTRIKNKIDKNKIYFSKYVSINAIGIEFNYI